MEENIGIENEEVEKIEQWSEILGDLIEEMLDERNIENASFFREPEKDLKGITGRYGIHFSSAEGKRDEDFIVWPDDLVYGYFVDLAEDEYGADIEEEEEKKSKTQTETELIEEVTKIELEAFDLIDEMIEEEEAE